MTEAHQRTCLGLSSKKRICDNHQPEIYCTAIALSKRTRDMDFKLALCVCVCQWWVYHMRRITHVHTHTYTLYIIPQIPHSPVWMSSLNNFREYKFQTFYTPIGREVKLQQIFLLEYNVKRKKFFKYVSELKFCLYCFRQWKNCSLLSIIHEYMFHLVIIITNKHQMLNIEDLLQVKWPGF